MIVVYIGRRGKGKTLSMVKDAYLEHKRGRKVISNMENVPFARFMSNEDILKLSKDSSIQDCVLLVDELQIFFDSRRAMKKVNISFSNFIQQIRKRNVLLLATTQFANAVDKRLRDHTDIQARPNYLDKFKLCEVEYIDITSLEDPSNMGIPIIRKVVFNALPIFNLYNTKEMF